MIGKGLSLDQAPPFMAPFSFFITAPIFAVFAGFVLLVSDSSLFFHRLSPEFLAVVHLITIGYFSMVMIGSMQQMLPVLAGVQFDSPMRNAKIILFLTSAGATLFFFGFYFSQAIVINIATIFLFAGLFVFIFVVLKALLKVKNKNDSVRAMSYAVISFLVAIICGAYVGFSYGGISEYSDFFASFHIAWVFFGWAMLLVIGVSFQVIPMFYVSSPYPEILRFKGVLTIFAILIALTILRVFGLFDYFYFHKLLEVVMLGIFVIFAYITIKKIKERKRAVVDTSLLFWYVAMSSLIVGIFVWIYGSIAANEQIITLSGIIIAVGFLLSLINGMLYKIVPFLVWFHLSNMGYFDAPTMRDILNDKRARYQLYFHLISFLFFVLALLFNLVLFKIAGLFFIISNILLFINLFICAKVYFKTKSQPLPKMNFDMSAFMKK